MQSFMIPQLGGQIYAMAGMTTQLNSPRRPGSFIGENTQYNGDGFARQQFRLLALSQRRSTVVARAKLHPTGSTGRYRSLTRPGTIDQPRLLRLEPPGHVRADRARATQRKAGSEPMTDTISCSAVCVR